VRCGGTIAVIGVYIGMKDQLPMNTLFDTQIQIRIRQANVKYLVGDIMRLLVDADPLGVNDFATHHLSLKEASEAYEMYRKNQD
jgi:threonine dehydrogenase-like Zn-dependent dehydrogenase